MRISPPSLAALFALALALAAGACAGDSPDPVVRKCTKSLYEPCITEHDCATGFCNEVPDQGLICTTGCDTAIPCPDLNGEAVTCTMNLCKPSAPVECEVVP